jgi:hypothetical protein
MERGAKREEGMEGGRKGGLRKGVGTKGKKGRRKKEELRWRRESKGRGKDKKKRNKGRGEGRSKEGKRGERRMVGKGDGAINGKREEC